MENNDEYVFNNKLYALSIRDLKATFFDILSSDDSGISTDEKEEYTKKILILKNNMSNIIESIEELDSFYSQKNEDTSTKNLVSSSNSDVNVEKDNFNDIKFNNVIDYPNPVKNDSILDKKDSNENVIANDESNEFVLPPLDTQVNLSDTQDNAVQPITEKEDVSNNEIVFKDASDLIKEAIENDKLDDVTVNNDEDKLMITKANTDPVKVILVSDKQFGKLNSSRKMQKEVVNNIGIFNFDKKEEIAEKVNILINEAQEEESNESLADKAVRLYKEGKTEEAQAIMDKINSLG